MSKYVCFHGHFYQPPRENPWLEEVEMQDSAYPYHDWNERITAECYAQNAASRILDSDGRIRRIVNNYARMSFNFGPTLLSWLEKNEPNTYAAILEADRESRRRFSGHGSACAQAYNHAILPLANARDKETQVVWGIRDFESRFGRPPEGMWLPETAVDTDSLEVLAKNGIHFAILSPYQAKRVRPIGGTTWTEAADGAVDPRRAYRVNLPSGRSIAIFFYDGPASRAVAFERLLNSGEAFAGRLISRLSKDKKLAELEHIATDGESYGHHHRHGDMALAYALQYVEEHSDVKLSIYGEFLERHPPEYEAEIVEETAWSCAHGVERWRSDCGCNSGGHSGWNQKWRSALRDALDWLRDSLTKPFEQLGAKLFRDPWAARNDYVSVLMSRSPESIERFLERNALGPLQDSDRGRAVKLMELQRHALYMYTSCGWFFDDVSGIETVQIIQYAGRAVQLAQDLFGDSLHEQFMSRLELARSNAPEWGNGRMVYEKAVQPTVINLKKVAAHYAVNSLFDDSAESSSIYCYDIEQLSGETRVSGRMKLVFGRATVRSAVTLDSVTVSYAALLLGDHNIAGGVRQFAGEDAYRLATEEVSTAFSKADIPALIRLFDKHFPHDTFSLRSLFRDRQRQVIELLLAETVGSAQASFERIYDQNAPLMLFLSDSGVPVPSALHTAAEQALNARLRSTLSGPAPEVATAEQLLAEAKDRKIAIDSTGLAFVYSRTLKDLALEASRDPTDADVIGQLIEAVDLAQRLPFAVDLWFAQNVYYRLNKNRAPDIRARAVDGDEAARRWVDCFKKLGGLLKISSKTA